MNMIEAQKEHTRHVEAFNRIANAPTAFFRLFRLRRHIAAINRIENQYPHIRALANFRAEYPRDAVSLCRVH